MWIVGNGLHRMLEDMRAKRAKMRAQIDRIVLMGTQEMLVEPRPRLFSPLRKRQTRHGQTIGSNRASSARGHHHANAARPHPRCAREHARRQNHRLRLVHKENSGLLACGLEGLIGSDETGSMRPSRGTSGLGASGLDRKHAFAARARALRQLDEAPWRL